MMGQTVLLVSRGAEGHERFVLAGMHELIDRPVVIVETHSDESIEATAERWRYRHERIPGSSNVILTPA